MTAMLWKEWREQRFKIFAMLALIGGCYVVLIIAPELVRRYVESWFVFGVLLAGAILGFDVIASERMKQTLAFLSARPISIGEILLAKFAVGGAGVLVISVALVGPLYFGLSHPQEFLGLGADQILDMVPMSRMVWMAFLCGLFFYCVAFLGSLLADDIGKALLCALVFGLALFLSAVVGQLAFVGDYLEPIPMYYPISGRSIIPLNSLSFMMVQTGWIMVLVACTFLGGWALLHHSFQFSLGWRQIIAIGVFFIASIWAIEKFELVESPGRANYRTQPVTGKLSFETEPRYMAKSGSLVAVVTKSGIALVDASDKSNPIKVGFLEMPNWRLYAVTIDRQMVYGVGSHKVDGKLHADFIAVDVRDSHAPVVQQIVRLGRDGGFYEVGPICVFGDRVYVGVVRSERSQVLVLKNESGKILQTGYVMVENKSDMQDVLQIWRQKGIAVRESMVFDSFWSKRKDDIQLRMDMEVSQNHLYLATAKGYVVFDLEDPDQPREVHRQSLNDLWANTLGFFRRDLSIQGNKAYVTSFFPRALVELDLQDPAHPLEIRRLGSRRVLRDMTAAGEYMYASSIVDSRIEVIDLKDTVWRGDAVQRLGFDLPGRFNSYFRALPSEGYIYTLHGKHLVIFPEQKPN